MLLSWYAASVLFVLGYTVLSIRGEISAVRKLWQKHSIWHDSSFFSRVCLPLRLLLQRVCAVAVAVATFMRKARAACGDGEYHIFVWTGARMVRHVARVLLRHTCQRLVPHLCIPSLFFCTTFLSHIVEHNIFRNTVYDSSVYQNFYSFVFVRGIYGMGGLFIDGYGWVRERERCVQKWEVV